MTCKYTLPGVDLSNFVTSTVINRNKYRLCDLKTCLNSLKANWICFRVIYFNQPVITRILLCVQCSSVKFLIWIIMDSKSKCLWLFSVFNEHATYSNLRLLKSPAVSTVWGVASVGRGTVNMNSTHPNLRENNYLSMKWKVSNLRENNYLSMKWKVFITMTS